jgi:hypothetical protein
MLLAFIDFTHFSINYHFPRFKMNGIHQFLMNPLVGTSNISEADTKVREFSESVWRHGVVALVEEIP